MTPSWADAVTVVLIVGACFDARVWWSVAAWVLALGAFRLWRESRERARVMGELGARLARLEDYERGVTK